MNTPAAPSRSWFATHPSLAPGPLRILMGILSFVGLFALLVLVPVVALPSWLRLPPGDSAAWSVGASTLILWGTLLALLYGAKVVARPTRLFGPLIVAASGAALLYLISILPLARIFCSRTAARKARATSSSSGLADHCCWFLEKICIASHPMRRASSGARASPPEMPMWAPKIMGSPAGRGGSSSPQGLPAADGEGRVTRFSTK